MKSRKRNPNQKKYSLSFRSAQKGFDSGLFDENLMENIDETHFVVNMDNGRTLGFRGYTSTKYTEVVSGGDSMTLVV